MKRLLVLVASHGTAVLLGFGLGVYLLPILTAPATPSAAAVATIAGTAQYQGRFRRDLKGSDLLHWGEGDVAIGRQAIALMGKISPGPDYKLYLVPDFVEDEEQFVKVKSRSVRVGDIKTFENFVVPVPQNIDVGQYTTVLVWCETFSEFISAAKYR